MLITTDTFNSKLFLCIYIHFHPASVSIKFIFFFAISSHTYRLKIVCTCRNNKLLWHENMFEIDFYLLKRILLHDTVIFINMQEWICIILTLDRCIQIAFGRAAHQKILSIFKNLIWFSTLFTATGKRILYNMYKLHF